MNGKDFTIDGESSVWDPEPLSSDQEFDRESVYSEGWMAFLDGVFEDEGPYEELDKLDEVPWLATWKLGYFDAMEDRDE